MSKTSCLIVIVFSLLKNGQEFLDKQYVYRTCSAAAAEREEDDDTAERGEYNARDEIVLLQVEQGHIVYCIAGQLLLKAEIVLLKRRIHQMFFFCMFGLP